MIKEILQENKSVSKGKINKKQSNSIINGINFYKKLNLFKKPKCANTLRKNKNLELLLNKNENIYAKKITNLKTTSFNRTIKEKKEFIFESNNCFNNFNKRINYTSRDCLKNNYIISNEETKVETSFDKNKYINRINSSDYNLIYNLDKEFEIRCLKKKLEKVKMKNNEIKNKLNKLKENNFSLKNNAIKELNNRNNIFYSLQNIYQTFFQKGKKIDFKTMLLDLMELKYNYDNVYLINIFFQNIEKLIQISNIYNEKVNIYSNIENILRKKNKIINELGKLNNYQKQKLKYFDFCELLFENFETKDLDYIFNYLIKLESNNENDIRKIIKMRNILFNDNDINNNSKRLNTNINSEKLKRNKSQNLNYSDFHNINKSTKRKNDKNNGYGYFSERNKLIGKNLILNLKNQTSNNNYKIDKEKINNFLYSSKRDKLSSFSKSKKEISYNYNDLKEKNYSKTKKSGINLNTLSTNITQINSTPIFIYSINNENENVLNLNKHKKINYNDNVKNNKIHSRIPSLKKIKNYHPIYYK